MITQAQQRLLDMPFPVSAHGFVNGQIYLRKDAIRTRLNGVDPEWTMTQPQLVAESGDVVMYAAGLAVCGVLRWGLGTGIIQQLEPRRGKNPGELIDPSPFEIARTVAFAHKKAAGDVIARAAIEFGVGLYLKRVPKGTSNETVLAKWLDGLTPHWAYNGGGNRVKALMIELGLEWADVAEQIEPGRTLPRLSETWLTMAQFEERLHALAAEHPQADETPAT